MREPHDDVDFEFKFAGSDGNEIEFFDYNFSPSFGSLANSIRKSSRSLGNRLHSIKKDSEFVERVVRAYQLPIVTNARAGDWYVDPRKRDGCVYFKSTDGHTGQWKFSSRRLNLGLLEIVAKGYGAIIVDSTRRGKRFPDSLAKTVPIWIAVLNKVCFPGEDCILYTNPLAVSPSEASQIEQQLNGFIKQFQSLGMDLDPIKGLLKKPLRPIWVTPDSPLPPSPPKFTDFLPLILVTASHMIKDEGIEGEYIQGAGDDHEGWASESGLTPATFWENQQVLLGADDEELLELILSFTRSPGLNRTDHSVTVDVTLVNPTVEIYVGSWSSVKAYGNGFEVIVNCSTDPLEAGDPKCKVIDFPIPDGKKGGKVLRMELENIVALLDKNIPQKVVFVCPSGNDLAPAVALVILCLYYDDRGRFQKLDDRAGINKAYIRRRLAWISSSRPEANPSRSSLKAVNSFLMGRIV